MPAQDDGLTALLSSRIVSSPGSTSPSDGRAGPSAQPAGNAITTAQHGGLHQMFQNGLGVIRSSNRVAVGLKDSMTMPPACIPPRRSGDFKGVKPTWPPFYVNHNVIVIDKDQEIVETTEFGKRCQRIFGTAGAVRGKNSPSRSPLERHTREGASSI